MKQMPRIDLSLVRTAQARRLATRLAAGKRSGRAAFAARGGKLEGNKAS